MGVVVVVDATLSDYLPRVCYFVFENGVRCSIGGRRFGLFFFFEEKTARAFSAIAWETSSLSVRSGKFFDFYRRERKKPP